MTYKFTGGKAHLKKIKDLPTPRSLIGPDGTGESATSHISISQPDGSRVAVPTLEVDAPSNMLGVYFCPAGNGKTHVTSMTAKGENRQAPGKITAHKRCMAKFFLVIVPRDELGPTYCHRASKQARTRMSTTLL